ncbi:Bug family tripartite tricarboxylate transporter substrate binding protein [Microbacterium invictum]|uniref:Tripartite tricarboxylate transporter substrate-binding protein n=1 Tax=Microbacterium invictum TaxID=515415 RepID=A0ABZ0VFQ0_9MICO|nr:tripartite tricarboxylate transporter substrate-binding protein [Microbacterium invictum]WQB71360.1 tripartite tricarboxylate transporter substrate-binding protein [Microbacterium invictum]
MRRTVLTAGMAGIAILALTACNPQGPGAGGGSDDASPDAATLPDAVQIIVPADPGGGWDQTGRAVSSTLTEDGLVSTASVSNVGGAGGTVGLAGLANERDPNTLMVTGLVMVGAVETNAAETRMEDTTPIARLTEEPLVVVVPASSEYQTLQDLIDDVVDNGQSVTITGGSAGGADHILAGLLLENAGLDGAEITEKLNYIPNAGGGEAVSLLLGDNASAGISGVGEFAQYVESGDLRALAVSSEEPAALLPDAPTMVDEGFDVVYTNWRGLLAPGDITEDEKAGLVDLIGQMNESGTWESVLETNGWTDAFLTGDEFDAFLSENIADVQGTLQNIGLIQ